MEKHRITEAEIIDVLLGGADPVLEARVRQSVRHDPQAAAFYAHWSGIIPDIQQEAAALKPLNERVKAGVMKRLADPALAGALPFVEVEAGIAGRWERLRPRWLNARTLAIAAAALVVVGLAGSLAWQWLNPALVAESVSGRLVAIHPGESPAAVRPGDRIPLPVRLQSEAGAQAEIRLAGEGRLKLAGTAEVAIEGRRHVRQAAGSVQYEVAHSLFGRRFTVQIPQGTVEDLATEFRVAVSGMERTVVRVSEGRVRVSPDGGRSVEAGAGERAIVHPDGAVVEPIPPWTDLGQARREFKTNLLQRGPVPLAGAPLAPPEGAREAQYPSGGLSLRAWISNVPGDGRRHPAVVYAHNNFGLSPQDWENTAALRQAGFVIIAPQWRGESGNPGHFECCWGEVDDLLAAGEWAASIPGVDPARLYLVGHDEGGTLAMLAAMLPSRFTAVAAIDAHTDMTGFAEAAGGSLPFDAQSPTERMVRSPRFFPASIRCPLYLILGQSDTALIPDARDLAREATELGRPCRVWTVPGDHTTALTGALRQCVQLFSPSS